MKKIFLIIISSLIIAILASFVIGYYSIIILIIAGAIIALTFLKADANNIQVLYLFGEHFKTIADGKFYLFLEKPFLKIRKFTRGNIVFVLNEQVEYMANGKVKEINTIKATVELQIVDALKFSITTTLLSLIGEEEINKFLQMQIFQAPINDFRSTVDQIGKKIGYEDLKNDSDWKEARLRNFQTAQGGDTFFEKIANFGLKFISVTLDVDENPLVIEQRKALIEEGAKHGVRIIKVKNEKEAEFLAAKKDKEIQEKNAETKASVENKLGINRLNLVKNLSSDLKNEDFFKDLSASQREAHISKILDLDDPNNKTSRTIFDMGLNGEDMKSLILEGIDKIFEK